MASSAILLGGTKAPHVAHGRRANKTRQRPRVPARHYSSTQWDTMKPTIIQLYCEEKVSIAELLGRLHRVGFEVNERMLHTRIKTWKIGRNHKFSEMRTAAERLVAYQDRQGQPFHQSGIVQGSLNHKRAEMPSFTIRGESISYEEFLRYFRRKKIHDPLTWVKDHQDDNFVLSDDVELVPAAEAAMRDSSSGEEAMEVASYHDRAATVLIEQDELLPYKRDNDASNMVRWGSDGSCVDTYTPLEHQSDMTYSGTPDISSMLALRHVNSNSAPSSLPSFLRPHTYHGLERLTYSMTVYIASYLSMPNRKADREPTVHAHMAHAIFASKMQDGISILSRVPPPDTSTGSLSKVNRQHPTAAEAITAFDSGFDKIRRILLNHSPMSLALMLSIACELAGRTTSTWMQSLGGGSLLVQFLRYTQNMAVAVLGPQHPLTALFSLLAQELLAPSAMTSPDTPPLTDMIFAAFQVAISQLQASSDPSSATAATHSQDWRQLYLRERFCDALYHSGPTFQQARSSMRKQLLHDQEQKYGLAARNVLWTLTNVADDCLASGDVDPAIGWFGEALVRAETLVEDYGRAKTRFAALEGLGRCWLAKAAASRAREDEAMTGQHGFATTFSRHLENTLPNAPATSGTVSPCCSCNCHASHAGSANGTGDSTPNRSSLSIYDSSRTQSPHSPQNLRTRCLRKALHFFSEAETEARGYFEPSSRRITRVASRRMEVVEMLGLATPISTDDSSEVSPDLTDAMLGSAVNFGAQDFNLDLYSRIDLSANASDGGNADFNHVQSGGGATLQDEWLSLSLAGTEMIPGQAGAFTHKGRADTLHATGPDLGRPIPLPITTGTYSHTATATATATAANDHQRQLALSAPFQELWYGLDADPFGVQMEDDEAKILF